MKKKVSDLYPIFKASLVVLANRGQHFRCPSGDVYIIKVRTFADVYLVK